MMVGFLRSDTIECIAELGLTLDDVCDAILGLSVADYCAGPGYAWRSMGIR